MTTATDPRMIKLLTDTIVMSGNAPDETASARMMEVADIIAATMDHGDARGAFEDAKAIIEGVTVPQYVWTLTAEITDADGEYGGISTVHATLGGALEALDDWLINAGIDLDSAHWGEVRTDTSLCNDPDPDLLGGAELHWGINQAEVRA